MKMSIAMQNYLEIIYETNLAGAKVRVSDMASKLGVSKPSVNNALNVLKEQGFVNYERYGDITLTDIGESQAQKIFKKHQTIKKLFVNVLGMEEEMADDDACRIEHVISQDAVEAIEKYLEKTDNN